MFSTNTILSSSATSKNPRRRQRPLDEIVNFPGTKRQKSLPRDDAPSNNANGENIQDHSIPGETNLQNNSLNNKSFSLSATAPIDPLHGNSNHIDPFGGPVNSLKLLANNSVFSAAQLPVLPDSAKEILQAPYRCAILPHVGYCLALTSGHAIIWHYRPRSASFTTNIVSILSIPSAPGIIGSNLPLGTLVPSPTRQEPGLVLVRPSTGEVLFWETIASQTVLGTTKPNQPSLKSVIPRLYSSEHVTDMIDADPAGIVIVLSSGRLCHLIIRSAQGQFSFNFQFLNDPHWLAGGSLFGGIRSVFSGTSGRSSIAAVKAGKSLRRGHRVIMVVTNAGSVETWDLHWNRGGTIQSQAEIAKAISGALKRHDISDEPQSPYQIVDFTFFQNDPLEAHETTETSYTIWALISVDREESKSYFAIEISIHSTDATPGRSVPVQSHPAISLHSTPWTPQIYVPSPRDTGYVVFETGVVFLPLAPWQESQESPSSQLLADMNVASSDYLKLRNSEGYFVLGCGLDYTSDDKGNRTCIAIMVQNYGLIRISIRSLHSSLENQTTIKSRLEQIAFYSIQGNPIDLACYSELYDSVELLEKASLQISKEILKSTSKFVSGNTPNIQEQLDLRLNALRSLATFLVGQHFALSSTTRWELLCDAERLAAQKATLKTQGDILRKSLPSESYLEKILKQMAESLDDDSSRNNGFVHSWFIHETWQMEKIIQWIPKGLEHVLDSKSRLEKPLLWQVWQASELSLAILETTFRFRDNNAGLYGLDPISPENGDLIPTNYKDTPALWFAQKSYFVYTQRLLDLEINVCLQWIKTFGSNPQSRDDDAFQIMEQIKNNTPRTFRVLWRLYAECFQWHISQSAVEVRNSGEELRKNFLSHRKSCLYKMAVMGLLSESIELAESFHDMDALVELTIHLEDESSQQRPSALENSSHNEVELKACQNRIDTYFQKFGEAWATPFYTRQILAGHPETLFLMPEHQEHLTRFLRSRPTYAALGWVNEIHGERNFANASLSLEKLATNYESNLWNKQVELAIGKLSRLAMLESPQSQEFGELRADLKRFDDNAEFSRIQDLLYKHILPSIHGAIDHSAELQLASEQFGKVIVDSRPALQEGLQRGLAKLIDNRPVEVDELIDVLTLMDPVSPTEEESEIVGHEFSLALKVLSFSGLNCSDDYRETLRKLIWRRCMIRDNWSAIEEAKQQKPNQLESAIQSTTLFQTLEDLEATGDESLFYGPYYLPSNIVDMDIYPHQLASRLQPEQRARLLDDLDTEYQSLRTNVARYNLDGWFVYAVNIIKSKSMEPSTEV